MKTKSHNFENAQFLDPSEQNQLNSLAQKLGVPPEVVKTAIRASRCNDVESITNYIESHRQAPSKLAVLLR